MKHRIFIAINLPEEIKKGLASYQSKWPELPVRWVKPENLHVTLEFLGYVTDDELVRVCQTTRELASKHKPFTLQLNKICYGPPEKRVPTKWVPRMIWVEGEKSRELSELKNDLEKSLSSSRIRFEAENREFRPHITLGRVKAWEWRQIEPEERPGVETEISLNFKVNSIEVMESRLKPQGSEYTVLESIGLG